MGTPPTPLAVGCVRAGVLGSLALLALAGCGVGRSGGEVLAASRAALGPDASPAGRAVLHLGAFATAKKPAPTAMEFEVGLKRATDGHDSVLKLIADGEALEREVYESRPEAFAVVAEGDDAFRPSLDLLRYPVRNGAAWEWSGKVVYGGVSRDATAQVTTSRDGGDIRSDVALTVSVEGSPADLRRNLSFWFRKGRGVVSRTFGDVSSRRPVGEPWRP